MDADAQHAAVAVALFGKADVNGTGLVKRDDLLKTLTTESALAGSIGLSANV